jgi:hypothetical protein
MYINAAGREEAPRTAQILFSMFAVVLGLVHIPKEKIPSRPRIDTLLPAATAALRAREAFSTLIGMIPIDLIRLHMLLPLINVGREVLRHAGHFHDLLYANLALWETEVEQILVSFYDKATPFGKDNDALADLLSPVREHFRGSAERGAETAAKNRELRKEAREAGIKEGEERARSQAREDASKTILDAIDKIRGKLGEGNKGDGNKG